MNEEEMFCDGCGELSIEKMRYYEQLALCKECYKEKIYEELYDAK